MASITALTGWRGVIRATDSNIGDIRFTDGDITVPLSIEVDKNVHAGVRTSSVYKYGLVKPTGNITFPLLSEDLTSTVETNDPTFSNQTKTLLKKAIQPYDTTTAALYPILDDDRITIYRGDSKKIIYNPWINQLTISGSAGQTLSASLEIKAITGEVLDDTTSLETLNVQFAKARGITFNELDWSTFATSLGGNLKSTLNAGTATVYPREFTLTVNNGLQDDETPNTDTGLTRITRVRAIRGFALGYQSVQLSMKFIGAVLPAVSGTVKQYSLPVNGINLGGLFTITSGIVTERSAPMPGNEEIAVTDITIEGMLAGADGKYIITPGTLLT